MDKAQTEKFWRKVDQISYGIEPILRYFLEANGFTNYSAFLHTSFDDSLANKMVQHVRTIRPGSKYYKNLSEWFCDEPLENFKLLEGWKSSLRTIFIAMNSCDSSMFIKPKEITPEEQKQQQEQTQQQIAIKNAVSQNISKRMKQIEEDPNFVPDLISKFKMKIFLKLRETDSNIPWNDHKEIPLTFVCDFDSGKKFEVKCAYCPSTLVVYWRYQQSTGNNLDAFYPKFNDCNYFKHLAKHMNGSRFVGSLKRRAEDSNDASYSNSDDYLQSHIKIEEQEW